MSLPRSLLVVADTLDGGLGAAARHHVRTFARDGWSVRLAAPGARSLPPDEAGVDLAAPPSAFDLRGMLTAARRLRVLAGSPRPHVVHAHGTRSQALCLLAFRSRPFVTFHGAGRLPGQSTVGTALRGGFLLVAPTLARQAFSVAPGTGPGWTTLLSASPRLAGLERRTRDELAPDPLFVWVGRLSPQKRPDLFVQAVAAVRERVPGARGVLLGDGPDTDAVRALNDELGHPVQLLGDVPDVEQHLRRAWAFCLFSHFEGIPFSLQEAMWVGVAPVLTPLAGNQHLAGDAAQWAPELPEAVAAMTRWCDPSRAWQAGQVAADRVRAVISADDPHEQLARAYGAA